MNQKNNKKYQLIIVTKTALCNLVELLFVQYPLNEIYETLKKYTKNCSESFNNSYKYCYLLSYVYMRIV